MKKSYLLTTLLLLFASPSFAYSDSYGTSGYDVFECIILLIFGILSIILFFKIWAMTDNVAKITTLFTESVNVKQENSLLAYYIRKEINGVEEANKFLTKCIIEDIESITSTNECTRKKYENAFNGVKKKYEAVMSYYGIEFPDMTGFLDIVVPTEYKGFKVGEKVKCRGMNIVIKGFNKQKDAVYYEDEEDPYFVEMSLISKIAE